MTKEKGGKEGRGKEGGSSGLPPIPSKSKGRWLKFWVSSVAVRKFKESSQLDYS